MWAWRALLPCLRIPFFRLRMLQDIQFCRYHYSETYRMVRPTGNLWLTNESQHIIGKPIVERYGGTSASSVICRSENHWLMQRAENVRLGCLHLSSSLQACSHVSSLGVKTITPRTHWRSFWQLERTAPSSVGDRQALTRVGKSSTKASSHAWLETFWYAQSSKPLNTRVANLVSWCGRRQWRPISWFNDSGWQV